MIEVFGFVLNGVMSKERQTGIDKLNNTAELAIQQ